MRRKKKVKKGMIYIIMYPYIGFFFFVKLIGDKRKQAQILGYVYSCSLLKWY